MTQGNLGNFENALSLERFGRYLAWAGNDRDAALELYALNTRISEALYTPLQTLEVVLRNRTHSVLADDRRDTWFNASSGIVIGPYQHDQVIKAVAGLQKEGKPVTAGGVVSSLTFSFWTTMLNKDYEALWQQVLHKIAGVDAPRGLKRKSFSGPLTQIRLLRNRIAHHEPILNWDLLRHHDRMLEMIGWLSDPAAHWCRQHDRFPRVHPATRIVLDSHVGASCRAAGAELASRTITRPWPRPTHHAA